MKYVVAPSPNSALKLLQDSGGAVVTIVGACRVEYAGRSLSFLDYGDRLVIVKPDGTIIVHGDSKREPLNWQPPGSEVRYSAADGLVLESTRRRPKEYMYIHFRDIRTVSIFRLEDRADIIKIGAEQHMVDRIEADPSVIEPGLRVLRREMTTRSGFIDLFCEDSEGRPVIVEVKRARVSPRAVHQLEAYLIDFRKKNGISARGILCAPHISAMALTLIEEKGLEYRKISYSFELPEAARIRNVKTEDRLPDGCSTT